MAYVPDFQALFEASPYPYMLMDRDMRIIAANRAYLKVTGAAASDVVGRIIFDAFPENAADPDATNLALVRASIERALATRQPDAMPFVRYSIPCPGGGFSERYWSSVHTPILGADGEVAFISQNSLDVTEFYQVDRRSGREAPHFGPAPGQEAGEQARTHAAMQRALLGERDYLRNLFNQSPGFMAVLAGPRHVFEMANEAYYALVGRRDIVGTPLWEALPDLRGQGFEELLDEVYRSGRPFVGRGIKARIRRVPGEPVADAWVDLLYQPLFGKDGRVTGIFVQGHDVTETHEAQLARRESEERLSEGMVAANMVVWDWDIATGRIVLSHNAEQVLGMRGDTLDEMSAPLVADDAARLNAAHERAVAEGGSYAETVRYVRPDSGRQIWLDVRGTLRRDEQGRPFSVRGVALDVTERMRAEEQLREEHRRKDEFLAMLAHELRNPLAPISSAAQLLRHGALDEGRRGQVTDVIIRQVRHVAGLLDDLIDVSRVTRGLISTARLPCDMRVVVEDALEQARPMLAARRQSLALELGEGEMCVQGDHKRLVQVLANLLNNASKYTPEGGSVTLAAAAADGVVRLSVRDNGIGMSADLLPRVFDLFTQGERSADRAQGGLGVGLAVVRSLVELHGGQVAASSAGAGQGSVFTVELPLMPPGGHGDCAAPVSAPPRPVANLSVLVVDDNDDAARTLALLLEAEGHAVVVEHSSAAALRRVALGAPDVCLLDIGLPDMDGYALAAHMRAMPAMRACRLVAVTGYGQRSDRARALSAGFDHHLVKPVDMAALLALLCGIAKA